MKTVIAGAGALGSVLGGYFAQVGAGVTLIARKLHVDAIRANGLVIEGMRGRQVVQNLRAVVDPAEVKSADLLILGVKSQDTPQTLALLRHLRGKLGAAISVQNGGRKEEELAEAFGREAVVGAATMVGATMPGPGRVFHTSNGATWIGELDGRPSARVEAIAELYRKADLPIEVRPDIRTVIWCKLNQMTAGAAVSCVTRLFLHQVYLDRGLATLFVELCREVAQLAERQGIPLEDFRGFGMKTVCSLPFADAVESVMARGRAMVEQGITQVKVSTLQDLERGKPTEADQVIGYVVRLAADLGVPVPTVELLYRIIRGVEAAQLASRPTG
ncbi:MAG: 2-dehydropantoate 2-reductase [candidate division NC10 bacterium]|nr:2-dehydropantoate 2-reductase [candidate division NC10 bacterium]